MNFYPKNDVIIATQLRSHYQIVIVKILYSVIHLLSQNFFNETVLVIIIFIIRKIIHDTMQKYANSNYFGTIFAKYSGKYYFVKLIRIYIFF